MTLGLAPSYAALCVAQAAVVALPVRTATRRGRGVVGVVVPVAALGIGVGVLNAAPLGSRTLALLGTVAAPLLTAAAGALAGRRTWALWPVAAAALWLVAWLGSGLAADAAGVALVGGACIGIAAAVARLAPSWSIELGLVVLAVVDVVLVWGTPTVTSATNALHAVAQPQLAGRPLPALQDATFGSALMGWLDLLAPALLGTVVVGRARVAAALATGLAAGAWGLLLFTTSTIPATVPALAGLAAARLVAAHVPSGHVSRSDL